MHWNNAKLQMVGFICVNKFASLMVCKTMFFLVESLQTATAMEITNNVMILQAQKGQKLVFLFDGWNFTYQSQLINK